MNGAGFRDGVAPAAERLAAVEVPELTALEWALLRPAMREKLRALIEVLDMSGASLESVARRRDALGELERLVPVIRREIERALTLALPATPPFPFGDVEHLDERVFDTRDVLDEALSGDCKIQPYRSGSTLAFLEVEGVSIAVMVRGTRRFPMPGQIACVVRAGLPEGIRFGVGPGRRRRSLWAWLRNEPRRTFGDTRIDPYYEVTGSLAVAREVLGERSRAILGTLGLCASLDANDGDLEMRYSVIEGSVPSLADALGRSLELIASIVHNLRERAGVGLGRLRTSGLHDAVECDAQGAARDDAR